MSSSLLSPTWIPFTSTQAAVETLAFNLRIMTSGCRRLRFSLFVSPLRSLILLLVGADDWRYERGSNVFYLGEPINMEASVRVGHHMALRVFLSSCVATLDPDIYSVPRYVFIENG